MGRADAYLWGSVITAPAPGVPDRDRGSSSPWLHLALLLSSLINGLRRIALSSSSVSFSLGFFSGPASFEFSLFVVIDSCGITPANEPRAFKIAWRVGSIRLSARVLRMPDA